MNCVGTNPMTAIFMVASDNGGATARMRDDLRQKIVGPKPFD